MYVENRKPIILFHDKMMIYVYGISKLNRHRELMISCGRIMDIVVIIRDRVSVENNVV